MVRILAGTLLEAGCGLRSAEQTASLVTATEGGEVPGRHSAGPTMPAGGLCLEHVEYESPWTAESSSTAGA